MSRSRKILDMLQVNAVCTETNFDQGKFSVLVVLFRKYTHCVLKLITTCLYINIFCTCNYNK